MPKKRIVPTEKAKGRRHIVIAGNCNAKGRKIYRSDRSRNNRERNLREALQELLTSEESSPLDSSEVEFIRAFWFNDLSLGETADVLEISVDQAETTRTWILQKLRAALENLL